MKPTQLALTAAAALVAGALVRWLLADDDEKEQAAHRTAALRARYQLKRARPRSGERAAGDRQALQQNNALAVAYGGSQEAVDVAARALQAAEAAARERRWTKRWRACGRDRGREEVGDLAWWGDGRAPAAEPGRQLADTVAKCRRAGRRS